MRLIGQLQLTSCCAAMETLPRRCAFHDPSKPRNAQSVLFSLYSVKDARVTHGSRVGQAICTSSLSRPVLSTPFQGHESGEIA